MNTRTLLAILVLVAVGIVVMLIHEWPQTKLPAERVERVAISSGPQWTLTDSQRLRFDGFLKRHIKELSGRFTELNLAARSVEKVDIFAEFEATPNPRYHLRQAECRFVADIARGLAPAEKKTWAALTRDGHVCVPADLPAELRDQWVLELLDFIAYQPWIRVGVKRYSLFDWLGHSLAIPDLPKPNFHVLRNVELNGYAFAWSRRDREKLVQYPIMERLVDACSRWDINNVSAFPDFGAAVGEYVRKEPQERAAFCIPDPRLYVSADWPVSTLIEVLTHEWGHLYHFTQREFVRPQGDGEPLRLDRDLVLEEGVAEAFAWLALSPLYETYPQVARFHILKLASYFQEESPAPQVLGAAALLDIFYSPKRPQPELFKSLVRSPSFADFLRSQKVDHVLRNSGPEQITVLELRSAGPLQTAAEAN